MASIKNKKMDRQLKIKAAYDAVLEGRLSARAASREFGVPRSTLQDRLAHRISIEKAAKTSLSAEEENKFSQWVIQMARAGFGWTMEDFLRNVQEYLNQLNEPTLRFKNDNKPGKTWYYDYLSRHPELTERSGRALGSHRAIVTLAKIESWFEAFEQFLEIADPSLKDEPARWFNANESRFALCLKSRKVIALLAPKAARGDRHLNLSTSSSQKQITTLCCMSASGRYVGPMIVYPGKRLCVNPVNDFRECAVGLSESGWMTGELFVDWLKNVFVKALGGVKRPVILLVDGSSAHKSKQASDVCLKNGIILYCLQASATHLLQPLDLSFFGSINHHWGEAVMDYLIKNPGMSVTKSSFALVFKTAYEKACTAEVARAGFKGAGLFPLCKEAALNTKKMMVSDYLVGSPVSLSPPVSCSSVPFSSSVPPSSSVSLPEPTMAEKLIVLEAVMTEEVRVKYATRFEEGYDLQDDPFYSAWKECKLLSVSSTPSIPIVSPKSSSLPDCLPSTSTSFSSPSTQNLDSFLLSKCLRVCERKKRIVKKVVPNMALTGDQMMDYFETLEEEKKVEKNILREERKRKKKQFDEEKEERKKLAKEKRKQVKEKKKGKGKDVKRFRYDSSCEDDANVVLDDDSDVSE